MVDLFRRKKANEQITVSAGVLLNVALVTIANGADNIGVYMPLFAGYSAAQMMATVLIFSGMVALWCFLGKKLAGLPGLRKLLLKYKGIFVPLVFVVLGVYIIIKAL